MNQITRPMLAATLKDVADLKFPAFVTPKLDGIRCLIINGEALSRNFKPIPNMYIRQALKTLPDGLDGELVAGTFNETSSAVMSASGEPNFTYVVFDYAGGALERDYCLRMRDLHELALPSFCEKLLPKKILHLGEFEQYEAQWVADGYEGIMGRSGTGHYKCGRATLKEGYLWKFKRFADSEAEVIGFEELMQNTNPAAVDAFGLAERSSHKAGMVGKGMLGAFHVRDLKTKQEFKVASGMTDAQRIDWWQHIVRPGPEYLTGKILKYKYQPSGAKDLPRFPVFLGFRDAGDRS